jgi:hypothetical protein
MAIDQSTPPLCACGCGLSVGKNLNPSRASGHWNKWVHGHHGRQWKVANPRGRMYPSRMIKRRRVLLHVERAEQALGRKLPVGAVVHHADGTRSAQAPLVICQDQGYHLLLHKRTRAVRAGYDPDVVAWCSKCRQYKVRSEFYVRGQSSDRAGQPISMCIACSKARIRSKQAQQPDMVVNLGS